MAIQEALYSSQTDMWETPQDLFDDLDREFHFDLDVCAIPENAKCKKFYTPEQDGRLAELPFVAMVEQSLQDGKMKPMADQKHNGRYAVVYVDHNKWKSPLIDICGKPYNREEAENRMAALALKGGEG